MSAVQGAVGAGFSGDNIADGFVDCAVRAVRTLEIYFFLERTEDDSLSFGQAQICADAQI